MSTRKATGFKSMQVTWDKQFWILGLSLAKKSIPCRKRNSGTFACVHGCYLLYETFPHKGRQTQRYFNVPSLSSHRDNYTNMAKNKIPYPTVKFTIENTIINYKDFPAIKLPNIKLQTIITFSLLISTKTIKPQKI